MSSVVAVVKKVRRNDEDNDEYNPMKMLKTSIASKVQVRYQKLSNKFIFISFVLRYHGFEASDLISEELQETIMLNVLILSSGSSAQVIN